MNHVTEILSAQVQPQTPNLLAGVHKKKVKCNECAYFCRTDTEFIMHNHISQIFKLSKILSVVLFPKCKAHIIDLEHVQSKFVLLFGED